MTYENHKKGKCDKCEKGKAKHKVPFLYLDKNDKAHEDLGKCYRQYYICDKCFKEKQEKTDK